MDNNIVSSIFRLMNCFFDDYIPTEVKKVEPEQIAHLAKILEPLWIFSVMWSLCCTVDRFGRQKFDTFVRERVK